MAASWEQLLEQERQKEYFSQLEAFLETEYRESTIYPKREDIFNSLTYTPYDRVKVVILGQGHIMVNQAHGLSFSVMPGVKVPPSLKTFIKSFMLILAVLFRIMAI